MGQLITNGGYFMEELIKCVDKHLLKAAAEMLEDNGFDQYTNGLPEEAVVGFYINDDNSFNFAHKYVDDKSFTYTLPADWDKVNKLRPEHINQSKKQGKDALGTQPRISDPVEIAREKMPREFIWEVNEKNSMTAVPRWIIEAMIEFKNQ